MSDNICVRCGDSYEDWEVCRECHEETVKQAISFMPGSGEHLHEVVAQGKPIMTAERREPNKISEERLREVLEYFTKALEDDSFQPDSEPTDDEMKAALSYALACVRAVEAVRDVIAQACVYPDGEPCEGASYGECLIDMKLLLIKHLGEKP